MIIVWQFGPGRFGGVTCSSYFHTSFSPISSPYRAIKYEETRNQVWQFCGTKIRCYGLEKDNHTHKSETKNIRRTDRRNDKYRVTAHTLKYFFEIKAKN